MAAREGWSRGGVGSQAPLNKMTFLFIPPDSSQVTWLSPTSAGALSGAILSCPSPHSHTLPISVASVLYPDGTAGERLAVPPWPQGPAPRASQMASANETFPEYQWRNVLAAGGKTGLLEDGGPEGFRVRLSFLVRKAGRLCLLWHRVVGSGSHQRHHTRSLSLRVSTQVASREKPRFRRYHNNNT